MNVFPFDICKEEHNMLMEKLKVSDTGRSIMKDRFSLRSFMITGISTPAANVIKQHVLSLGGEAAVPKHSVNCSEPESDLVFSVREDKLPLLLEKFRSQCWKLPQVAEFVEQYMSAKKPWFSFRSDNIDTSRPLVMGILNVTPDSFSDGGRHFSFENAMSRAEQMIAENVDILDIGGESTKPGALPVDEAEEIARVAPVIKKIKELHPGTMISIDTSKSGVAKAALDSGAEMVNDISGLTFDPEMAGLIGARNVPVILMHILGKPSTMQNNPQYSDLFSEMIAFFNRSVELAVKNGIKKEKIVIDPGIGFGKTYSHNLLIIKHLEVFHCLSLPMLVGLSRKSLIGTATGRSIPEERLAGTIALNYKVLEKGAAIIRVHNVKEAFDTIAVYQALKEPSCL